MEAEGRGARRRALDRLEAAAVAVQACVARGCSGRALAREASERRELQRHNARLNWAASLLQTRRVKTHRKTRPGVARFILRILHIRQDNCASLASVREQRVWMDRVEHVARGVQRAMNSPCASCKCVCSQPVQKTFCPCLRSVSVGEPPPSPTAGCGRLQLGLERQRWR